MVCVILTIDHIVVDLLTISQVAAHLASVFGKALPCILNITTDVISSWGPLTVTRYSLLLDKVQEECSPSVSYIERISFLLTATYCRTVGLITALVRLTFQTAAPAAIW